ncbi:GNAT family N-acetyltransferase [Peijinzhouia sedimentorum]
MKITELTADSAGQFLEKLNQLIMETVNMPIKAKHHFQNQWTEASLTAQIGNWIFLSAKNEQDEISGLLLGTPCEGGVGTIVWVLVESKKQKMGLGKQLFDKAVDIYKEKGAHKIKLTVPEEKTVEFYKKQGMRLEGHHPNHWWNHEFWSMGLILKED